MAVATRWRLKSDTVFIRTHLQNALNEIHRHSVYEHLSHTFPLLAASQYSWLSRPSVPVLEDYFAQHRHYVTTRGIPQGDAPSSLVFAVAMAGPLRELNADFPECHAVACADDVLLGSSPCPPPRQKSMAGPHRPHGVCPQSVEYWHLGPQPYRCSSRKHARRPTLPRKSSSCVACQLTIKGISLQSGQLHLAPLPSPERFWKRLRANCSSVCVFFSALVDVLGPSLPAVHMAVQILRVNLSVSSHIFSEPVPGILCMSGLECCRLMLRHGLVRHSLAPFLAQLHNSLLPCPCGLQDLAS